VSVVVDALPRYHENQPLEVLLADVAAAALVLAASTVAAFDAV
jgi:hypothetical protein